MNNILFIKEMEAQKIKILINIRVSALKKSFEINVAKSGTLGELKQFIIGQFSSHLKAVEGELEIGLGNLFGFNVKLIFYRLES